MSSAEYVTKCTYIECYKIDFTKLQVANEMQQLNVMGLVNLLKMECFWIPYEKREIEVDHVSL